MSELGDFLERFYSAAPAFRTVRARVRYTHAKPSGAKPRHVIGRRKQVDAPQQKSTAALALWAEPPGKLRLETTRTHEGQEETKVDVYNPQDVWTRYGDGTLQRAPRAKPGEDEPRSLPTGFQRHFDRDLLREVFAALTLEADGNCVVANRRCLRIRAVPTRHGHLWPHWLAWEADAYEFAADLERPVLFSIIGTSNGVPTETHEVLEVAFDEELDESLFVCEVQPDETVQLAPRIVERISLAEAVARAPFTVLRPTWLPEEDRLQCETMYNPAQHDGPDEHVTLYYRGSSSFRSLWIKQRAKRDEQMQKELEWEVVIVDGRTLEISDPSPVAGSRVVTLEQDETWVDMTSDMPREDLCRIAVSLQPASR